MEYETGEIFISTFFLYVLSLSFAPYSKKIFVFSAIINNQVMSCYTEAGMGSRLRP
ncbi:MAG: hypothetical protein LBJ00_01915 [Planctomycetaceae bacterium]|nr:hypothetical protein [Planctomycetaceae bacterium]